MLPFDAMSFEDYLAQLVSIVLATLRVGDRKINMQLRHHLEYYVCDYKRRTASLTDPLLGRR